MHTVHEDHKDYKCKSCGKSFLEKGKLKKNVHIVHEIQKDLQENKKATLVEDKIPLIQCNICEKNSKQKSTTSTYKRSS